MQAPRRGLPSHKLCKCQETLLCWSQNLWTYGTLDKISKLIDVCFPICLGPLERIKNEVLRNAITKRIKRTDQLLHTRNQANKTHPTQAQKLKRLNRRRRFRLSTNSPMFLKYSMPSTLLFPGTAIPTHKIGEEPG